LQGAPVDLAPRFDDPVLAADPLRNNNFTFAHPGEDILSNQTRCPFSAHVRKTRPRADFNPFNTVNHIIRAGIPYGPEGEMVLGCFCMARQFAEYTFSSDQCGEFPA